MKAQMMAMVEKVNIVPEPVGSHVDSESKTRFYLLKSITIKDPLESLCLNIRWMSITATCAQDATIYSCTV